MMSMKTWGFALLIGLCLFGWPPAHGKASESAEFPSLVSALDVGNSLTFCGEKVPLENQDVLERLEKELLLSLWDRAQVILWLKRSRRYLPPIEQMLKEQGLPDDLKYIAIVESALRPHAGSRKGAIGFWQFLKYTGLKYGLKINRYVDERRNLFASTAAAIKYFKTLHQEFGSWSLVAAAYNMGEEGLMSAMLEQDTRNYYLLYLPLETQRFLFRILSVKLILSDPEKYGFNLDDNDYYPPLEFDRIQLTCHQQTPIRLVAEAAKSHFKMIKDLNPEIRGHYLRKGRHEILIPKGSSDGFTARYEKLLKTYADVRKESVYIVKAGDNLSSIAERFDIPLQSLLIWNRLNPGRPIHPGDKLIIYPE
jgi:hypothetical protein